MFFARIASLTLLAGFVSAAPCARDVKARQVSVDIELNITDVLDTLLDTTDSLLPQIAALAGNVTEDVALPLVQDLLSAVDTATSVLGGLTPTVPAATSAEKREAGEAVAELLSGLLADVSDTVNPILADLNKIPAVAELLKTLDPVLSTLLSTVEGLLPGVIALVAGLLGTVTGLLSSLGLGGVLSVLNL